jgi:hypothetical protein
MSLPMMRGALVFVVAAAYVVLNEGFMILLIPPTRSGLPIAELVLALVLLTFVFEIRHLPGFVQVAPIMALTVWWTLGATQAALGFGEYGIWALRDATNVIESLYLWVGFIIASHPVFHERFGRWLRILMMILIAYNMLYPLKDLLVKLSPTITAPAGYSTYIFFKYNSGSLGLLTAAVWVLVDRVKFLRIPPWALAGCFIVFSIAFFQMRTTYLQILALLIVFAFLQPRTVVQMSGGMLIGLLALMILLASGLEITGRLGAKFTMEFFWDHIAAIWGAKGESAEVAGAAGGVDQRVKWWTDIWRDVTASVETLFLGLGYGMPLTSFKYYDGQIVREPHNSVISVFARLGLVGITAFLWMQISLFLIWYRTYRRMRETGASEWANSLLILGTFFVMVWIGSLGEDAFEKPFNTVPYYFFWGVILQARWRQIAPVGRRSRYSFGGVPARVGA